MRMRECRLGRVRRGKAFRFGLVWFGMWSGLAWFGLLPRCVPSPAPTIWSGPLLGSVVGSHGVAASMPQGFAEGRHPLSGRRPLRWMSGREGVLTLRVGRRAPRVDHRRAVDMRAPPQQLRISEGPGSTRAPQANQFTPSRVPVRGCGVGGAFWWGPAHHLTPVVCSSPRECPRAGRGAPYRAVDKKASPQ